MANLNMDAGKRAELIAAAVQGYLRSVCRFADPMWGRSRLHLADWTFDAHAIENPFGGIAVEIEPRLREWLTSDIGCWAKERVPGIEVHGMYDFRLDSIRLVVSARVDEDLRVEHAMRWSL